MKDFLFTLLAWLVTLPCIVAAVVFALYNNAEIPVTINPFQEPAPMPVYLPVLGGIAFGFLFGALMTWAATGRLRAERRDQKKKIRALEKQLDSRPPEPVRHNYAMVPSAFLTHKK